MSTIIPSGGGMITTQTEQQGVGSKAKVNNLERDAVKQDAKLANVQNVQLALHHINQKLADSNLKVEFSSDQPVGDVWLNVVDRTTGKVIQKIPSDGLRKMSETHSLKGLQFDNQS